MAIDKRNYKIFNEDWFLNHLCKDETLLNLAKSSFKTIHGETRNQEITIDVISKNLNPKRIELCRKSMDSLRAVVPKDLAMKIKLCANTYASFCDEVFAGLDDFYYQSVNAEWFLHSESSFKVKRYRDHLTHQAQVSLLGVEFLNGGISEISLLKEIVASLKKSNELNALLKAEQIQSNMITDDIVVSSWLLASLFHDLGYCFLSFIKTHQVVDGISSLFKTNALEEVWQNAEESIKESSYLVSFYRENCDLLSSSSTLEEVKVEIRKSAINSENHSVIGALYLLHFIRNVENSPNSPFKSNLDLKRKMTLVFELAALTILTHDLDCKKKRSTFEKELIFKDSMKIPFENYPLSYLLGVCDQIQEWGRVRFVREPKDNGECIENHIVDCAEASMKLKGRTLEIRYKISDESSKGHIPSFMFFNEFVPVNSDNNVYQSMDEIFEKYPEGKLSILNKIYGKNALWDNFSIFVEVGFITYSVKDFFSQTETKKLLDNYFTT